MENAQYQIIDNSTTSFKITNILRDDNNINYFYDSIKFKIDQ